MIENMRKQRCIWISAFLGGLLFLSIYGIKVLNPEYTSWLYSAGSDLTQHYLGWMAFRNSDVSFPIGLTDQLSYPEKISIIFTDSIPLFAVLFKLLASVLYRLFSYSLPENFQYFGWWGLLTFVLNGALSAKILQKYLQNKFQIAMGSVFFILSFQVLQRMFFHTALAAHWIILLSIYPMIYRKEVTRKKKMFIWALVGFLCSSVHLYFLAMCGLVFIGFAILDYGEEKQLPVIKRVGIEGIYFFVFIVTTILVTYILGGFAGGFTSYARGLGRGSLKLNGFINQQGKGVLLPQMPIMEGQYEGFAYLGAGIMFLLMVTVIELIRSRKLQEVCKTRMFVVGGIIFVAALCMSLSSKITLGEKVLLEIPVHEIVENLWATFRSTGRIAWVCVYLLFLFAMCADYKIVTSGKKTVFIMIALCIQLLDLTNMMRKCHMWSHEIIYEYQIDEKLWNNITEQNNIRHIIFTFDYTQNEDYPVTIYALEHNFATNDFYFARDYSMSARNWRRRFLENPQEETMYLWKANNTLDCYDYDLEYFQLDDNYVAGIKGNKEVQTGELKLGSYTFLFDEKYITQGYDENNIRYLEPGGASYGPYIYVPEGTYEICVEGVGIGALDYQSGENNKDIIETSKLYSGDDKQVFQMVCKEQIWEFEFRIENGTNEVAVIESIQIKRTE